MKDWQRIEAVLFGSGKYMTEEQLVQLSGVAKSKLKSALHELKKHYENINSSLDVFKENDSWKLNVKEEFSHIAKNVISEAEMSKPVMETLALIAYKTPVFQSEIVDMKGAGVYDYVALLEEKGFITKEKSGRSFKLKVTPKFFDYFDISGDSKLRALFKGVKKPDSLGSLEVYATPTEQKEDAEKTDEFTGQIIERMKKVETSSSENEEKNKFLNDFERRFEKTKTNIDDADKELNEFRRVEQNSSEQNISEGQNGLDAEINAEIDSGLDAKEETEDAIRKEELERRATRDDETFAQKEETSLHKPRARKVIFGDENEFGKNESDDPDIREKIESDDNYPDKILKNFESVLEKLDSSDIVDEEEIAETRENALRAREREDLKKTAQESLPKPKIGDNSSKLPLSPERIEKIKEEAIKERHKLILEQEHKFDVRVLKVKNSKSSSKEKSKDKSRK